jgi:virginiamycin B lyase
VRRLIPLALVLLAALIFVPSAGAYIYWSSYNSGASSIGRADLTGANATNNLVTGIYFGAGIGSDGSHIYWGESGNGAAGAIGRANVDGSSPEHAFTSSGTSCSVFGVRAIASTVYWLQAGGCGGTIVSYPGFGSAGGGSGACGFDVEGDHSYWSNGHYIARGLLNGTGVEPTWIDVGATGNPCGVAVDGTHVYWTNGNETHAAGSIGRANINGSEIEPGFVTGASFFGSHSLPPGIAVQGNFLYWTEQPVETGDVYGSIGRLGINGVGGIDSHFVEGVFFPVGLDVDTGGPAPSPPSPPPGPGPTAPSFPVGVNISNGSFTPGSSSTAVHGRVGTRSKKKAPVGTVFSYQLDQAASVKVELKRKGGGRLVGGKCKKLTKGNGKKKRCDRLVGNLYRTAAAGFNELPFSGRIKGKALLPGKYLALFTATGPGGTSPVVPVGFRILASTPRPKHPGR